MLWIRQQSNDSQQHYPADFLHGHLAQPHTHSASSSTVGNATGSGHSNTKKSAEGVDHTSQKFSPTPPSSRPYTHHIASPTSQAVDPLATPSTPSSISQDSVSPISVDTIGTIYYSYSARREPGCPISFSEWCFVPKFPLKRSSPAAGMYQMYTDERLLAPKGVHPCTYGTCPSSCVLLP